MNSAPAPLTATTQSDTWLTRQARRQPLVVFFILAYFFGWICFLPLVLTNTGLGIVRVSLPLELLLVAGASAPTLAALCTQWLLERNFRICRFYTSWKRALLGSVVALALAMFALVVLPAIALSKASPLALHWSALVTPSVYAVNLSTFLGGPANEEPGWRGFAMPRLQVRFGPLPGSILLGMLWAAWHVPLFFVRAWAGSPIWSFFVYVIAVSVLITWATNFARFSIIAPILMHATSNTSTRLINALYKDVPMRQHDSAIYLGTVVVVTFAVIVLTRGRLGHQE
jgi:membrane protease YdiL (CAAX protease family)